MGIVYSYLTSAAMWQNFRARLPYLYDPWSEMRPPAPTLMHAMIAISILVEAGAVFTGLLAIPFGLQSLAVTRSISYCICAVLVSIGLSSFLAGRGVPFTAVWFWRSPDDIAPRPFAWLRGNATGRRSAIPSLLAGALCGIAIGLLAQAYIAILSHIPFTSPMVALAHQEMANLTFRISYGIAAIAFAPFAEEYLFRGLLFKALDREWGGWHAILGSAAFFAIYHQPIAWLPVFLVGIANALLFKKTGRLAPCIALHILYNAVVISLT
jgi:membrane protease YdiL (CAAX protease family)